MTQLPETIEDAARAIREGELTSVELTEAMLEKADDIDPALGVYLHRSDENALAAAAEADADLAAGRDRGPLQGVPIALKDNLTTVDAPTTAQSRVLQEDGPRLRFDGEAVSALRAAGAVVMGKTTLIEFARGEVETDGPFPVPRNPWDLARWAGGSSSGTASGVAAGLFLGGLGTDTGGSVRLPAAYCGVSGLMPTKGTVPMSGCIPLSKSLDRIGPIARSARGCGLLLQAIRSEASGEEMFRGRVALDELVASDGAGSGAEGLRIGIDPAQFVDRPEVPADVQQAFHAARQTLADADGRVVLVEVPGRDAMNIASEIVISAEGFALHARSLRSRWELYGQGTRKTLTIGATYSAADYVSATQAVERVRGQIGALFETVDVLALPTTASVAPRLDGRDAPRGSLARSAFMRMWNLLGYPCISIPMGFSETGLPLGLQLVGRPHAEAVILRIAQAFQQLTEWHTMRPPVGRDAT